MPDIARRVHDAMGALSSTAIEAADIDGAEALLRRGGAPSTIRRTGAGQVGFGFDAALQSDGDFTAARYRLSGTWVLRAEPDRFVVTSADTTALRWEKGGERGVLADGSVQLGPGANAVHLDGAAEVFEFQFTPSALHRLAADAYGVEQVRLREGVSRPRDPAHAAYWAAVMQYTRTLFEGGLLRNEHLRAALRSNLGITLLEGFSLVDGMREWRLSPAGALDAFRRAVAFIESAATRPITALDVARAAGLPFRQLNQHFLTQTGTSVSQYLRTARVIGAHTQLVRATPSAEVAEAVVHRWGFTSVQTFLPLHRRQYPGRALPFELG